MVAPLDGKVKKALTVYSAADRVQVCTSAVRGIGYWLHHQASSGSTLDSDLVAVLARLAMKHESNEVKQLAAQIVTYVSKATPPGHALSEEARRSLTPVMVMGTKEKNAAVKSYSEHALIALLQLRVGDSVLQATIQVLESGMVDSLNEVVSKTLRKLLSQPEPRDDDIDNTVLK
jgi:hypothetical protein